MPPRKISTNITFATADGRKLKLEDIPTFEWTAEDEELTRHLCADPAFEMTFTLTDEAMNALEQTTAPAKNLIEKIKNALGEYFAECEALNEQNNRVNRQVRHKATR